MSKEAACFFRRLLIAAPQPARFFQSSATHADNILKRSEKLSSYDGLREGFVHPLETEKSMKLRFVEQGKLTMYHIKHFYEDFTGNSEVKEAQSKVSELQHKLDIVMDKRNNSELELIEVKKQLAELNSSQQKVTREDIQYLDLLKTEFKLFSEKQRLDSLIEVLSYEHQLLLMQLTHALNEVHAKERHEANTLRLIKLLLTTLVAVIGFAGNAGYNHYKDAKVQNHMKLQSTLLQTVVEYVEQEKSRQATAPIESWGSYLFRQPGRLYGYLLPKQSSESWGSSLYRQPVRLYRYIFPKNP
uniref:Uncharacterized protein n=1 Tax=Anopheles christyi TaxID=43041 RepID=A0A182KB25_9DIPT